MRSWRGEEELTGCGSNTIIEGFFVLSREGTESFVADGEENHSDEREEEGGCRANVPLAEDDAEIGGVPSEQHLPRSAFARTYG
jgi:hypothetical protein